MHRLKQKPHLHTSQRLSPAHYDRESEWISDISANQQWNLVDTLVNQFPASCDNVTRERIPCPREAAHHRQCVWPVTRKKTLQTHVDCIDIKCVTI